MITVKSFYIPDKPAFELALPKDARFLTVAQLTEVPEIMFLVESNATLETRYFTKTTLGFKLDYDKEKLEYMGFFAQRYKYWFIFEVLNEHPVQSAKLQTKS